MNWDILGHEWTVELLKRHITQREVRHAYLFTGPQGVGRRTLALRFAEALNCTQPVVPGEPCRSCRVCTQMERMQHPDLAVVQTGLDAERLKVDQIRELQRSLSLHPYEARYRVALLLNFEQANSNAMNALLKTLEEPAPQVILLLTAESAESLLPTIASRCEELRLRPLSPQKVSQGLQERWGLPLEQAELLAHISGGRPGYALRLHQEPALLEQRKAWLDDHFRLLAANRVERFAYVEALAKDKESQRRALSVWLSLWRDVLLEAAGAANPISNLDRGDEIKALAARFGLQTAHHATTALERTLTMLDTTYVNPRLAAEVLMLDLPYK